MGHCSCQRLHPLQRAAGLTVRADAGARPLARRLVWRCACHQLRDRHCPGTACETGARPSRDAEPDTGPGGALRARDRYRGVRDCPRRHLRACCGRPGPGRCPGAFGRGTRTRRVAAKRRGRAGAQARGRRSAFGQPGRGGNGALSRHACWRGIACAPPDDTGAAIQPRTLRASRRDQSNLALCRLGHCADGGVAGCESTRAAHVSDRRAALLGRGSGRDGTGGPRAADQRRAGAWSDPARAPPHAGTGPTGRGDAGPDRHRLPRQDRHADGTRSGACPR